MTTLVSHQLFVYGTLRKGFHHPAYQYISNYFHFIGPGKVKGLLYDLGQYPAAIPSTTEDFIIGELYVLKNEDEFDWAIAQLDDYEGVNGENGNIALYRRDITTVFLEGQQTEAWIYWYNANIGNHPRITSGDVLLYVEEKKSK